MKTYKVKKGFVIQKIEDKMVIFDGEESTLYTFNDTSSYIFNKLKLGWNKEQIIKGIEKKYEAKKEKIAKDFDEILKTLIAKRIITERK